MPSGLRALHAGARHLAGERPGRPHRADRTRLHPLDGPHTTSVTVRSRQAHARRDSAGTSRPYSIPPVHLPIDMGGARAHRPAHSRAGVDGAPGGSCVRRACGSSGGGGVRGWGRDGLGTGARGRGARARRALMSTARPGNGGARNGPRGLGGYLMPTMRSPVRKIASRPSTATAPTEARSPQMRRRSPTPIQPWSRQTRIVCA